MSVDVSRWARDAGVALVSGLLALGFAGPVCASPEDDFKAGMFAFDRSDFAAAIPALRKAAEAGHVEAQLALARVLDAADSDDEAVSYYQRAHDAGSLEGSYRLGTMVAAGEGTPKDVKRGLVLITRAADGGFKEAVGAMAQIYILGELEIGDEERTGPNALKWIRSAADLGFIVALEAMEKAYREGRFGLPVDIAKAEETRKKITTIRGNTGKKRRGSGEKP